jgi:hypothetical protein
VEEKKKKSGKQEDPKEGKRVVTALHWKVKEDIEINCFGLLGSQYYPLPAQANGKKG